MNHKPLDKETLNRLERTKLDVFTRRAARREVVNVLPDLIAAARRAEELEEASRALLCELTSYYFQAHDPELAAVNRLRDLLGIRRQLPKAEEAELQADEAEEYERREG